MKSIEEIMKNPELSIDVKLTNVLLELGIPCRNFGFEYIKSAVKRILDEPDTYGPTNKSIMSLMGSVANSYKSSPSNVERSIRHAVQVGLAKGNADTWNSLFRYAVDSSGKIRNSEFLFRIALMFREGV